MTNYTALNDVVVIKQDEVKTQNESGIYLGATDSLEAPWSGTILTLGELVPNNVQVGQRVYFKKYAGHEVEIDGDTLMLVPYEDVLLRIND